MGLCLHVDIREWCLDVSFSLYQTVWRPAREAEGGRGMELDQLSWTQPKPSLGQICLRTVGLGLGGSP